MEKIFQITRISQQNGKMAGEKVELLNKTTMIFFNFLLKKKVNTPVKLKSLQRKKDCSLVWLIKPK